MEKEKIDKKNVSFLNILKENISFAPALLIIPYVIGFFSVNLYLYEQGITTSESLNLNYLTIGLINIFIIFSSIVSLLISFAINKTISSHKNSILISLSFYNATSITLILAQINILFDRIDYVTWTMGPLLILLILIVIILMKVKVSNLLLTSFNLILIIILIYLFIMGKDYIKYFFEIHIMIWLLMLLSLILTLSFKGDIENTIIGVISCAGITIITCVVVYSSIIYIPNLRISIGGIRPIIGQIFLKDECKFNDKDSLSIYYKIDHHEPVIILYESEKKIIIDDSLQTVEIEFDCIKSMTRLHRIMK